MRDWGHVLVPPQRRMFCDWCGRELTGTKAVSWPGGVMDWHYAFSIAAHSVMVMPGTLADNPAHRHCTRQAA